MVELSNSELERQELERRLQKLDKENYVVTIATGDVPHRSQLMLAEPLASDSPLVEPASHRALADESAESDDTADAIASDSDTQTGSVQVAADTGDTGSDVGGSDVSE